MSESNLLARISARVFDEPSTPVKQSATVLGVLVAIVATIVFPDLRVTHELSLWVSLILLAIASILAVVWREDHRYHGIVMIVPAIDLLAIGFFRSATGGPGSLFSSLIILPVVWLAAGEGRRFIAYSAIGTSIALSVSPLTGQVLPTSPSEWLRMVFTPVVFATAAAIINELARLGRAQVASIKKLADEKERMLSDTVEYAVRLQESENRYRAADRLFRGLWGAVTQQSVIGTDTEGLIDAWNPGATAMLGVAAYDAEDRMHIFDFHVDDELEAYAKQRNYPPGATVLNPGFSALVEEARQGSADVRQWTYVRADGSTLPVSVSVTPRLDEAGDVAGYLFVAADITSALEAVRLKDEFVGLISHELRTPLTSILGYLELLREDDAARSPEQRQYLDIVERNAHRLLRLVGDLLFTAQVESGELALTTRPVELADIVTTSVQSAGPAASDAGVAVSVELPPTNPVVDGDPVRLGQAVDNLLSNAIKFTPRGGTVRLALDLRDDEAVITVSDTGLGIPADELDQLFARFFRATTATKNAVPGVGLGLTITRAIVQAHGGRVDVESEEGVGTTFTVIIPHAR
ncbi:signal transduction histidine kinase [Microbacteriaceae bacterium SG_E_30_P1]|uniref:histidine kinase n=1 Tax=Antiquaquibacter oligotrophicus TaxID=2880260 RepID=A0ABT6KR30_9MICO|nr:ATP-binding protein [Antiquaquibacter oligotrophicus]MDH6181943.1 signal transduction histidine kinase [Antiquaquibacter oligotrophicus]UDF12387.1 PAS domain-containing sensor histidine kinase [Antiquaquibacter oligotrophicus]